MKKEGRGILIDKKGNKYKGIWEKNSIDGYGRLISINRDYYERGIKNGILEGNRMFYSYAYKMI